MNGRNDRSQKPEGGPLFGQAALWEKVARFYHETLVKGAEGPACLARHGLNDSGLVQAFRIGCATGTLLRVLPTQGGARDTLRDMGILDESGRERFLDCLTFPLLDADGALAGLSGVRLANGQAVVIPDAAMALWNAPILRTHAELIATEGIIEALTLQRAGCPNVIALVDGELTEADRAAIRSGGVQQISCVGVAGSVERLAAAFTGLPCTVRRCPVEQPFNATLVRHGPQRVAEVLQAALITPDLPEPTGPQVSPAEPIPDGFRVRFDRRRYELRGIEKGPRRLRATLRTEHGGRLHVDSIDFYSARARKTLTQDLCRFFEETNETIESDIVRLIRCCESHEPPAGQPLPDRVADIPEAERREAEAFGRSPDLVERLVADYAACGLVGEKANKVLCYLAAVSRKTQDPLSILILSSSGAGKSALQDATLAFCPPEDVVKLTSLSGKALFYKARQSLKHKILALEEGAGAEESGYAIRNLISAGELVIEVTVKDFGTGKLTTMVNRVEGPTSVFITTTDPETDPETRSRFFVTSVDESREQTRAILAAQRRRQTLDGQREREAREAVLRRHRNFQRLLQPIKVVNPFAEQLSYGDDRLQSRRDQPKYLNLIRTVAFLRQMQKQVKYAEGVEHVEVDEADIRTAGALATEVLGRDLDDLNHVSLDLLMHLERMVHGKIGEARQRSGETVPEPSEVVFSRREIREFTGWAHTRVRRYLKQLIELEFVVMASRRFGAAYRYRLSYDGHGEETEPLLPGLPDVATGGQCWPGGGHPSKSAQEPDNSVVTTGGGQNDGEA